MFQPAFELLLPFFSLYISTLLSRRYNVTIKRHKCTSTSKMRPATFTETVTGIVLICCPLISFTTVPIWSIRLYGKTFVR